VRLPARLLKATHYREGMELQLQLRDDGSLLLSPLHGFNRLISGDAALCQAASHCGLIMHAPEDWPPRLSHRR